mmetsp:Transcript_33225/g.59485  ORF Transcript_33225/g.59485 Transcript_33225/m.59485 type:complete len:222 (+) Transcript_33225:1108-1773(+)
MDCCRSIGRAGGQAVHRAVADPAGRGALPHQRGRLAGMLSAADAGERQGRAGAWRGGAAQQCQALGAGVAVGSRRRRAGACATKGARAHPNKRPPLEGGGGARVGGRRAHPAQPSGGVLSAACGAVARARSARDVRKREKGSEQGARGGAHRPRHLDHRRQAGGGERQRKDGRQDRDARHQVAPKPRRRHRPRLLAQGGGELGEGQAAQPGHLPGDRARGG